MKNFFISMAASLTFLFVIGLLVGGFFLVAHLIAVYVTVKMALYFAAFVGSIVAVLFLWGMGNQLAIEWGWIKTEEDESTK